MNNSSSWPELSIADWKETCTTLHMWTQIIGKIRTVQMPWTNHSWHVTLYATPRGLTTLAMPYGQRTFQIDFDFIDHRLQLASSDGALQQFELRPMTVAEFYERVFQSLEQMDIKVAIHGSPNEVDPAVPFVEDVEHQSYDARSVDRFRQALVQTDRVMKQFRAGFYRQVQSRALLLGQL